MSNIGDVQITEPMTFATDLLLTIASVFWGGRLLLANRRWWGAAFMAVAVGALAGALHHGLRGAAAPFAVQALWKATGVLIAGASCLLLVAARRSLAILALVKFAAVAGWFVFHDAFVYVLIDYGVSLLILLFVVRSGWIVGCVVLSFVAGAVQQSGFDLHRQFNHNDLYHLIQFVALWMLYRGALLTPAAGPAASRRIRGS